MDYISGNIYLREMPFDKEGQIVLGHKHNFDHTTYVVRGSVLIESLNEDGTTKQSAIKKASDGKNWALIKAGVMHRITCLEAPAMAHCIYSHRTPQDEIVQEYSGWTKGYE